MHSKNLYDALKILTQEQLAQLNEEMLNSNSGNITMSDRFKKKMNRMFRKQLGINCNIPHPEADNVYERMCSKIIGFFLATANRIRRR